MNPVKKIIAKRREKSIATELEALFKTANRRREGVSDTYLHIDDLLTESEWKQYEQLGWDHQVVCVALGKESKYFNPKVHGVVPFNVDDSPKGLLRVTEDKSRKVSFEYDEENGLGMRDEEGNLTYESSEDPKTKEEN